METAQDRRFVDFTGIVEVIDFTSDLLILEESTYEYEG
jgi:hypothetical protein